MTDAQPPIESDFADDPEMLEIIELFVDQMPSRISTLESAWRDRDHASLLRAAHQLKGASAGYGYASVGDAAGELEDALRSHEDALIESMAAQVNELVDLCRRVVVSVERE